MKKTIIILLVIASNVAFAQVKFSALGIAGNIGSLSNHKGGGVNGDISIFGKVNKHFGEITAQYFEGGYEHNLPMEQYWMYGAYYGRSIPGTKDKIIYSGGLGLIHGTTKGDFWFEEKAHGFFNGDYTLRYHYKETVTMPVLMIKLEGRFPLAQIIDFRTCLYANLTYKIPSAGFKIGFGFGKVRQKKR